MGCQLQDNLFQGLLLSDHDFDDDLMAPSVIQITPLVVTLACLTHCDGSPDSALYTRLRQ
jgi:hypothetical protein